MRPRNRTATTLKAFLDDYFAGLSVKPGTATAYGQTRRCLEKFFGENKPLRDIEAADADKWRQWLKTANARDNDRNTISEATIGRRVRQAGRTVRLAGCVAAEPPVERYQRPDWTYRSYRRRYAGILRQIVRGSSLHPH